jgi:hypothetical protein
MPKQQQGDKKAATVTYLLIDRVGGERIAEAPEVKHDVAC